MIELRAKLGLTFEAFEIRGFLSEFGRKDLYDDGPVKLGVEGLINGALAARADLCEDLVLIDLRANHINFGSRYLDCGFFHKPTRTTAQTKIIYADAVISQSAKPTS